MKFCLLSALLIVSVSGIKHSSVKSLKDNGGDGTTESDNAYITKYSTETMLK